MTLKVAKYYLNYEYLKGFKEFPERYLEIEERIVDCLNQEQNLELIQQEYMQNSWKELMEGLFSFSKQLFNHMFLLNQNCADNY